MSETSTNSIKGPLLLAAMRQGADRVISERSYLDDINVFPVPDGDTGTNSASTVASILEDRFPGPESESCGEMAANMADAILLGARGNSGAIMTQFFQGMASGLAGHDDCDPSVFASSVETGVQWAYDAVSKPVEGTILTVMKDWSLSLRKNSKESDMKVILAASQKDLRISLESTRERMMELKGVDLVDAGAKGFSLLIEGFSDFLVDGKIASQKPRLKNVLDKAAETAHDVAFDEEKYRFCTECVISGSELSAIKLRKALEKLGDSVVVAGADKKLRLHIHTDDPEGVFNKARQLGEIIQEKVDDMHMQFLHRNRNPKRSVGIVVDSGCDLPKEIMESALIHAVPFRIQFGQEGFIDKITLTLSEFYKRLKTSNVHPTTSQPLAIDFKRAYEVVCKEYDEVISLHVPANLSGTVQAAQNASKSLGKNIEIFDSNSVSIGLGLLARAAAEMANEGKSGSEILEELKKLRASAKVFCILDTMEFLVRGGRVAKIKGVVGKWLKVKPILSVSDDGYLLPAGTVRNQNKVLPKLVELAEKACKGRKSARLAVAHADDLHTAERLKEMIEKNIRAKDLIISEISPAIGVHAGPGAIAIAVIGE